MNVINFTFIESKCHVSWSTNEIPMSMLLTHGFSAAQQYSRFMWQAAYRPQCCKHVQAELADLFNSDMLLMTTQ